MTNKILDYTTSCLLHTHPQHVWLHIIQYQYTTSFITQHPFVITLRQVYCQARGLWWHIATVVRLCFVSAGPPFQNTGLVLWRLARHVKKILPCPKECVLVLNVFIGHSIVDPHTTRGFRYRTTKEGKKETQPVEDVNTNSHNTKSHNTNSPHSTNALTHPRTFSEIEYIQGNRENVKLEVVVLPTQKPSLCTKHIPKHHHNPPPPHP